MQRPMSVIGSWAPLLAATLAWSSAGCEDKSSSPPPAPPVVGSATAAATPQTAAARPKGPGAAVRISKDHAIENVPASVVPHGAGTSMTLTDLAYDKGKVSVAYTKHEAVAAFTLVVCISMPDELLYLYLDSKRRLMLNKDGKVGFGMDGLGESMAANSGKLSYQVPSSIHGIYSLGKGKGTVTAFAVQGEVNPRGALPGDQKGGEAFQAVSHVLQIPVER